MPADPIPGQLAAACAQVRAASPADSFDSFQGGPLPAFVAAPASPEEAGAVLAAASDLGLAVLPRGAGTRLGWGAPPRRCDLVLETRLLNRVLEHAAGDLVVRVQAGLPLQQLARVLAAAGQRLALDPPPTAAVADCAASADGFADSDGSADRAADGAADSDEIADADRGADGAADSDGSADPVAGTVGGMLATGVAGPLRFRYGTPRDLVIGITVVLADGTVARSGGKVVKNVAGYDLGKLFAGSYGTLGLIADATFRVHPLPAARAFVTLDCPDAAAARAALSTAADSPLAPSAAEIDRPTRSARIRVGILLEGDADGVGERRARLLELLGGAAAAADAPPTWWGRGPAAQRDGTVLRVAFWAGELTGVLAAVDAAASAAGLDPALGGSAAAGVLHAAVAADAPPAAVAGFVDALRARLPGTVPTGAAASLRSSSPAAADPPSPAAAAGLPSRASAVVLHAPAEVRELVDLWGPVPSLGMMRAVKDQFDPGYLMAPGRFAGGI
jgi:glycolate oxidase FAD binding subunit